MSHGGKGERGRNQPIIAGGNKTRTLLVPLTVLGRFDDELKGVFHVRRRGQKEQERNCF